MTLFSTLKFYLLLCLASLAPAYEIKLYTDPNGSGCNSGSYVVCVDFPPLECCSIQPSTAGAMLTPITSDQTYSRAMFNYNCDMGAGYTGVISSLTCVSLSSNSNVRFLSAVWDSTGGCSVAATAPVTTGKNQCRKPKPRIIRREENKKCREPDIYVHQYPNGTKAAYKIPPGKLATVLEWTKNSIEKLETLEQADPETTKRLFEGDETPVQTQKVTA